MKYCKFCGTELWEGDKNPDKIRFKDFAMFDTETGAPKYKFKACLICNVAFVKNHEGWPHTEHELVDLSVTSRVADHRALRVTSPGAGLPSRHRLNCPFEVEAAGLLPRWKLAEALQSLAASLATLMVQAIT